MYIISLRRRIAYNNSKIQYQNTGQDFRGFKRMGNLEMLFIGDMYEEEEEDDDYWTQEEWL